MQHKHFLSWACLAALDTTALPAWSQLSVSISGLLDAASTATSTMPSGLEPSSAAMSPSRAPKIWVPIGSRRWARTMPCRARTTLYASLGHKRNAHQDSQTALGLVCLMPSNGLCSERG